MNREFIKMVLMSTLAGLLAIVLSYVMFLSPVSIIAKWTALSFWGSVIYIFAGLAVVIFVPILVGVGVEGMMNNAFSGTYKFVSVPIVNSITFLLMFWGTYGIIRMLPVLDGIWSWIFTVFFGLVALGGFIFTHVMLEEDNIQYTDIIGKRQGFKTFIVSTLLLALVIGGSMKLAMNFDYGHATIKYHHGDYKRLVEMAENFAENNDYANAIDCYKSAWERKTSDKKRREISRKIERLEVRRDEYAAGLKEEIKTLLNTFSKVSFRYGKPENDLKKTQDKINELKKLVPDDDKDVAAFQKKLDYHNKRKR